MTHHSTKTKSNLAAAQRIVRQCYPSVDINNAFDLVNVALTALAATDRENITPLPDPARMPWIDLRDALWARFKDDDREDEDLCVSRGEALAILGWAGLFDRDAQPRRDEEERSFAIIRNAAERLNEVEREAFDAGFRSGYMNVLSNRNIEWTAYQTRRATNPPS